MTFFICFMYRDLIVYYVSASYSRGDHVYLIFYTSYARGDVIYLSAAMRMEAVFICLLIIYVPRYILEVSAEVVEFPNGSF